VKRIFCCCFNCNRPISSSASFYRLLRQKASKYSKLTHHSASTLDGALEQRRTNFYSWLPISQPRLTTP